MAEQKQPERRRAIPLVSKHTVVDGLMKPHPAEKFTFGFQFDKPPKFDLVELMVACEAETDQMLRAVAASLEAMIPNDARDPDYKVYRRMQDAILKVALYCQGAQKELSE